MRSSLYGFNANLPAAVNPANVNPGVGPDDEFRWMQDAVTTALKGNLIILGAPYVNLISAVTFRFYGWNTEGSACTFSLDTVTFSGISTSVPEPTAV